MKQFLASVGTAKLFAKRNGKLVHIADTKTLTQSTISFSTQFEEVRAGSGAVLMGRFNHDSDINITLSDMMWDLNYNVSNLNLEIGEDYIDTLVKQIQAIALPRYSTSTKMVNPPIVAIRFGNEVYLKGVIEGGISVTYSGPIGEDDKYKRVDISFSLHEIDPYDADTVQIGGSFRGLSRTLERRLFKG